MSNLRVTITNLLNDLETSFNDRSVPENDRKLYFDTLYGTLDAASTTSTLVYGHSLRTIITSIQSSLQTVSEHAYSERLRHMWQPATAALLNGYFDLASCYDADELSSRVSGLDITVTNGSSKPHSAPTVRSTEPSQKKKVKKSTLPVTTQPLTGPNPVAQLTDTIAIKVRCEKIKGPWFTNLPHVKCTKEDCSFCEKFWHALHLTKCTETKCHRSGTMCNAYGWSAHVYPTVWVSARKDHDAGKDFPGLKAYERLRLKDADPPPSIADGRESPTYASIMKSQKRGYSVDGAMLAPPSPKLVKTDDSVTIEADLLLSDPEVDANDWNSQIP